MTEDPGAPAWSFSDGDMAEIDALSAPYRYATVPPGWLEN
jgi:hypothetical protein